MTGPALVQHPEIPPSSRLPSNEKHTQNTRQGREDAREGSKERQEKAPPIKKEDR